MTRTICFFTGTRAEYSLLAPLMRGVKQDDDLCLRLLVSGMHLSPEFGHTVDRITEDGFRIDDTVEMLLSSDTPVGTAKSMGLGLIGLAESLRRLSPDLLVLLGDRYECLAAATAAMVLNIPIAHLHGGESTFGLIDEPIRHSITKMSHLHFTSTETYRNRVIQLGEHPDRVFNVGAIGIENIRNTALLSRRAIVDALGPLYAEPFFLVCYHPITLDPAATDQGLRGMLRALDHYPDHRVLFTKANADADGRKINAALDDYVRANPQRARAFSSLGNPLYVSVLAQCAAMVGNSSSGIIEAPSLGAPTVNIGDRQEGRVMAPSVLRAGNDETDIRRALDAALAWKAPPGEAEANPYHKPHTAREIVRILKTFDLTGIVRKRFHDLKA